VVLSRRLKINVSNFHPIHYRTADGILVSGRNSGTHWLRFMLSHALAKQYGLPAPTLSSGPESEAFICGPKQPVKHAQLPRIITSHSICSAAVGWGWVRSAFRLPPIVVLVRDPMEAMLSFHLKWGDRYAVTLEDYARLPASLSRPLADVWWYISFMNCWGKLAAKRRSHVLVVRYEDLQTSPKYWLSRVSGHLGLGLGQEALEAGLAVSGREAVGRSEDPKFGEVIVPSERARRALRFSRQDHLRLASVLAENLRYDFGYGYVGATRRRPLSLSALGLLIATVGYAGFSLFGRPELGLYLPAPWNELEQGVDFSALTVAGALAFPRWGLAWGGYMAGVAALVEAVQISPMVPGDGRLSDLLAESSGALLAPLLMLCLVRLVARFSKGPLRPGAQATDRAWS
jgi:hypothetical protein